MEIGIRKTFFINTAVTGICFLLTSTAYLAWTYHVVELMEAPAADAVTLIAAYIFQAAGIGLFSLFLHRRADLVQRFTYAVFGLHMGFLYLSYLCSSFVLVLIFGFSMNLLCGWIAGYYLYRLSGATDGSYSVMTLGAGYSAAIFASWLLSLPGRGVLYHTQIILVICLLLTVVAVVVIRIHVVSREAMVSSDTVSLETGPAEALEEARESVLKIRLPEEISRRRFLIMAGALIFLLSAVNSCGFSFPSDDIRNGISVEFSRLFYAAGLLIAGYANDKNRRYGAACTVVALAVPFFMLAVSGEPVARIVFWALSYFAFGFYTIYRIILLSDISREFSLLPLCGFGLLIGRLGDAVGKAVCLVLTGHVLVLAAFAALLFMGSMLLFLLIYQILFLPMPVAKRQRSDQEIFDHFSDSYNLSAREREVLRHLLDRKTNQEIADELCISDGTVKYHIHNLLQKTNCSNRMKLLAAYSAEQEA